MGLLAMKLPYTRSLPGSVWPSDSVIYRCQRSSSELGKITSCHDMTLARPRVSVNTHHSVYYKNCSVVNKFVCMFILFILLLQQSSSYIYVRCDDRYADISTLRDRQCYVWGVPKKNSGHFFQPWNVTYWINLRCAHIDWKATSTCHNSTFNVVY